MKIDIKIVIITILSFILIGFIMFRKNDTNNSVDYENEREIMQSKIDSLNILIIKSDSIMNILNIKYKNLDDENDTLIYENNELSKIISEKDIIISNSKEKYKKTKTKILKLKEKLKKLSENASKKLTNDELIDNLQNKFD